ncbi:MAG: hypothetical protein GF390_03800 [Candidatus Pacebacteria bacterium]|nr:hypothetical protein [Candidatus Paceibacterota bacterium]
MRKFLAVVMIMLGLMAVKTTAAQAAAHVWANKGSQTGTVNVGWVYRGSSCHVRYTEADQQMYKYDTVTNCDSGQLTIGHLTAGVKYRFVVSQDGTHWSAPVYAYATGSTQAAQAAVVKHQPVVKAEQRPTHEELPADNFRAQSYRDCSHQGSMDTAGPLNHDERKTGKCGTGVTNVRTVSGPHTGEITVYWTPSEVSDGQYHLIYGTESGVYTMGALNIGGSSNSFTVRGLNPGQRYYFKLVPVNQNRAGYSWEVSDVAS